MTDTLSSLIDQTALQWPEKEALLFIRKVKLENRITYTSLKVISDRVANGLKEMGLREGETVVVLMPKSPEAVLIHLGIQKAGAISVILNPGFKKDEIDYFLKDTGAKIVVTGKKEEALVRSIGDHIQILPIDTDSSFSEEKLFPFASSRPVESTRTLHDPALLIYTSGTTGQPKGAILTQQNLIEDARNIIRIWEISETDVLCHSLPLFHVHGLCFALHTPLLVGSRVVMVDEFSPEIAIDILSRKEGERACSVFMGVPTMYVKMIEKLEGRSEDFSHIRLFASGSAPLSPKDFERIKTVFGKEPVEREGMSETGMNFSNPLRGVKKPGSIGLPLPRVEVRVVNPETLKDAQAGEIGEFWLRGPNVTPGYWKKPRETEAAFVERWFRTGDLGRKDADGYYYITDRLKHIIISGGENISPKEIEAVLDRHERISEACVVGIPDEQWGEKVAAAVVLKSGGTLTAKEIRDYCKGVLLDWKCPKEILFVKELPRNRMGKVIKEQVIRLFLDSK